MSVFALDPATNDLVFEEGSLVLVTDPAEEAAQNLQNKFLFFLGEWFLDIRLGVPYFAYVFVKNPDLLLIRSLFRKVILSEPYVSRIEEISLSWDSAARHLSFSFRAVVDDGRVISGGNGAPFIVEPS